MCQHKFASFRKCCYSGREIEVGVQVVRLENQVKRFKVAAEALEKSEEELKTEKRKFQKDVSAVLTDATGWAKIVVSFEVLFGIKLCLSASGNIYRGGGLSSAIFCHPSDCGAPVTST